MFSWLFSLFARGDRDDVYRPRDRKIFSYFDGARLVAADPQQLWTAVMAVGPTLSIDIKVANSQHPDAAKAQANAVATIRKAFRLRPLVDGALLPAEGTLTDGECCELLDTFLLYAERVKKNSKSSATSAETTSLTISPSPGAAPASGPASASSSTGSDSSTVKPVPSPLASA